jgi:hypothetical protein
MGTDRPPQVGKRPDFAGLMALTGAASFAYWWVVKPTSDMTASMTEWPQVLSFSAVLLLLAGALLTYGRMVDQRSAVRRSWAAAGAATLSSIANIIEDGMQVEWAFFLFVAGEATLLVTLLVMSVSIVRRGTARDRLLALVPAGTAAGVVLFVLAGGPILLVTWLLAAALALGWPARIMAVSERPSPS